MVLLGVVFVCSFSYRKGVADDHDSPPTYIIDDKRIETSHNADKDSIALDILAIGSLVRPDYLVAQQETFGSHPTVRHFVPITELNDTEVDCHTNMTRETVSTIVGRCKRKRNPSYQLLGDLNGLYMSFRMIEKRGFGWICAQKRPIAGIMKYFENILGYKSAVVEGLQPQQHQQQQPSLSLPNHLIVMDDDTYIRTDKVLETVQQQPDDQPMATPGCLIRGPKTNFTLPWGGFGTIINRNALERFSTPIYCGEENLANNKNKDLSYTVCTNLKENLIGEQLVFQEGMSILDLMYKYAHDQPYLDYKSWNDAGFCLASDTTYGYFLNQYVLPSEPKPFAIDQNSMQPYLGSTFYIGYSMKHALNANRRQCHNQHNCHPIPDQQAPAHMCHVINSKEMRAHFQQDEQEHDK